MDEAEKKVSESMQDIMTDLNNRITEIAGHPMGISLCIFNAVEGGRISYASNIPTSFVKSAWLAMIAGWEKDTQNIPAHKIN